jgi:DNA-binding CsgD family transcriptional regulator
MTVMTVAAVQGPAALVARALTGDGGALVVRGGSRAGRAAVLAAAPAAGLHRLDTGGVPAESGLRGAGLHRLLRPLLPHVAALPRPQAAELLRVLGHRAGRVDRLVLGTAVLDLLTAAAADRPVLCRVECAELLDPVSLGALGFAGRRLTGSRVALLIAAGPGAEEALDGLPELALPGPAASSPRLTPQQWQVARLVAAGATNREVAARLQLSPRTVEHHLRQIFARLDVRSRVELTRELLTSPGTAAPR